MGVSGCDGRVVGYDRGGSSARDPEPFDGSDEGGEGTPRVQDVSELNGMLRAVHKVVPTEAPNRIGFRLAADLGKDKKND